MKAQFATMEAAISLAIILSAVTFVSKQMSASSTNSRLQESKLLQSIAIYDIFNQITKNASANNCLSSVTSGCASLLASNYSRIFKAGSVEIISDSITTNNAKNATARCASVFLHAVNKTRDICVIVGG